MIEPRGSKQKRLLSDAPAIGVTGDEERSDRVCARGAARFARDDNGGTRAQRLGKRPGERRLACAFPAFKRDETALRHTLNVRPRRSRASPPTLGRTNWRRQHVD